MLRKKRKAPRKYRGEIFAYQGAPARYVNQSPRLCSRVQLGLGRAVRDRTGRITSMPDKGEMVFYMPNMEPLYFGSWEDDRLPMPRYRQLVWRRRL